MVNNLPSNAGDAIQSLGWEDAQEKEMAIHSNILAWEIPWTEEPGKLQSMGSQTGRNDWGHMDAGHEVIHVRSFKTLSLIIPSASHLHIVNPIFHFDLEAYFVFMFLFTLSTFAW